MICAEGLELLGFSTVGLMKTEPVVRLGTVPLVPWKQVFLSMRRAADAVVLLSQVGHIQAQFLVETSEQPAWKLKFSW